MRFTSLAFLSGMQDAEHEFARDLSILPNERLDHLTRARTIGEVLKMIETQIQREKKK